MNVLIIGGRGREYALAYALSTTEGVNHIYVAPGNVGLEKFATRVKIDPTEIKRLLEFAISTDIDLTIVGPETSCAMGIADVFVKSNKRIVGVSQYASQLETSRQFGKTLIESAGLATDHYGYFKTTTAAIERLDDYGPPWVIKLDGLAAGKGVTTTTERGEAEAAIRQAFRGPTRGLLLCGFVDGVEATFGCLIINKRVVRHWEVWDYKRLLDGDEGPLTASMGAIVAPTRELSWILPFVNRVITETRIEDGFLEVGTIMPRMADYTVITEFNVHIGEPCVQAIVATNSNFLTEPMVRPSNDCRTLERCGVAFVVASSGYPQQETKMVDVKVTVGAHATVFPGNCNEIVGERYVGTGRICAIASSGRNRAEAVRQVYECDLSGDVIWRRDIGVGPPSTSAESH
jgi:phosphoribosylamine---glycine ligase